MQRRADLSRLVPGLLVAGLSIVSGGAAPADGKPFTMTLRSRTDEAQPGTFKVVERSESWDPSKTAVIVCDMWDVHHCLNATRRGAEMAPAMDRVLKAVRDAGGVVIHAPSDCIPYYKDHTARARALAVPRSKALPKDIGTWCYKIPAEERGVYPIDQSDGGEDDDPVEHKEWQSKLAAMGRNPKLPWTHETDMLTIDPARDYISASGEEIWSILESREVDNVILLGVHLNMCVLGRPFGLRQLAKNGKHVVLMRDLTDTMYNPTMPPKVSHFEGTAIMVEHAERYVCPTVSSEQILGGSPFRFKGESGRAAAPASAASTAP